MTPITIASSPAPASSALADLRGVSLEQLVAQHDEVQRWGPVWTDLRLLYRGGYEFLLAAGMTTQTRAAIVSTSTGIAVLDQMATEKRRRRFLWQFEAEPDVKYVSVWEKAHYINYFSAILNYFRHWLFSKTPTIRPVPLVATNATTGRIETTQPDAPEWWARFAANCTGGGKSFHDFVKDAFLETLLCRRSGWLIGRPPLSPQMEASIEGEFVSQRLAEELGLTQCLLTPYAADEIVDWETDGTGELMWAVLAKTQRVRVFPAARGEVRIFTYVDRHRWAMWRASQDGGAASTVEWMGGGVHQLGMVPFVMMEIPHDLWISNQIFTTCLNIFNRQVRLHASELLNLFSQPVLTSNDDEAASRIMGEGMFLRLRAGNKNGDNPETFGYAPTPTAPFERIQASLDATIQELYRQVHQLSLAVDAKSTNAIARSGISKQEDRKSIEVILAAFGGYVRQAIGRTCTIVSRIQGDNMRWDVQGFEDFDVTDLMEELQTFTMLATAEIHSKTARRELEKRFLTGRIMSGIDAATKAAIEREVNEYWEKQAEGAGGFEMPGSGGGAALVQPAAGEGGAGG